MLEWLVALTLVLLAMLALAGALLRGQQHLRLSRLRVEERARLEEVAVRLAALPWDAQELAPGVHHDLPEGGGVMWRVSHPYPEVKSITLTRPAAATSTRVLWTRAAALEVTR